MAEIRSWPTSEALVLKSERGYFGPSTTWPAPLSIVTFDFTDVDGLLGRDFLDQFKVTIDNGAGQVVLGPK